MITRTQNRVLSAQQAEGKKARLTSMEKAMLRWVIVDPEDRLLDADVGSGRMAEYLRRNMQCEVCGVSDSMEDVRYARALLRSSDILYATPGDIPWHDEAFDTVMMKLGGEDDATLKRKLSEAMRVLKPGGQLVLGAVCYPDVLMPIACRLADDDAAEHPLSKKALREMVSSQSYHDISFQRTGLALGVLIAWKDKPMIREMLEQA